jgi:hypothetical protein
MSEDRIWSREARPQKIPSKELELLISVLDGTNVVLFGFMPTSL